MVLQAAEDLRVLNERDAAALGALKVSYDLTRSH